jgi:transposase-like protein
VEEFRAEAARLRATRKRGAPRYPREMQRSAVPYARSTGGTISSAAKQLGISDMTLRRDRPRSPVRPWPVDEGDRTVSSPTNPLDGTRTKMNKAMTSQTAALALGIAMLSACGNLDPSGDASDTAESLSQLAPPADVKIRRARADGSGCPPGTYDANISGDRRSLQVRFSHYDLERRSDFQTRNCALMLELEVPAGKSVAVKSLLLSGYTHQAASVTVELGASYTFIGGGVGPGAVVTDNSYPEFTRVLRGPTEGAFIVRDVVEEGRLTFSKCGSSTATAVVNTRLLLSDDTRTGDGYANVASVESVGFITRSCASLDAGAPDAGLPDDGTASTPDAGAARPDAGLGRVDAGLDAGGHTREPGTLPVITSVDARGTLCPLGSTTSVVTDDGRDIAVKMANEAPVSLGGCVLSVRVTPPPGQRLTVDGFDARARVVLEGATQARLYSSFLFFDGRSEEESETKTVPAGPRGEFAFAGDFSSDPGRPYSSCGASSQLHVYLQASVPPGSFAPSNRIGISRVTDLRLRLEPCSK